jgi:hypothetical protein
MSALIACTVVAMSKQLDGAFLTRLMALARSALQVETLRHLQMALHHR